MNDGAGPGPRAWPFWRTWPFWRAWPPAVRAAAALGIVVLAAAGTVSAWQAGAFGLAASSGTGQGVPAPATAAVTRQDLAATTPVTATLGYAGSYTVIGQGGGTLTWLPSAGQVISQGQALYQVDNGSPVVLLYGGVPAWRPLAAGVTGADVTQLNHDLVTLGDARGADISAAGWDYFSAATAAGVRRLRSRLGASSPAGSLPLGQVVFAPEALRVSQLTASLGDPVSEPVAGTGQEPGPVAGPGAVLTATSDRHVVTIPLDAADQSEVKAGDPVSVTLPDGSSTPGVIASVGTVAATAPGPGGNPVTTIPVTVTLVHPSAAGTLDQAPVTVTITTASSPGPVLAVPVTALLAETPGGYVIEVAGPGNTRRYVPVATGPIFDDAAGLVQVTGTLVPGERVVVAAS